MTVGSVFFFNDTATTEIYTLSLHDALPICGGIRLGRRRPRLGRRGRRRCNAGRPFGSDHRVVRGLDLVGWRRSEEHTSELQSRQYLVCRLLLEKKKIIRLIDILLIITTSSS